MIYKIKKIIDDKLHYIYIFSFFFHFLGKIESNLIY